MLSFEGFNRFVLKARHAKFIEAVPAERAADMLARVATLIE